MKPPLLQWRTTRVYFIWGEAAHVMHLKMNAHFHVQFSLNWSWGWGSMTSQKQGRTMYLQLQHRVLALWCRDKTLFVIRIQSSKSTSSERFIFAVIVEKTSLFCRRSGIGNSILRSNLPGLNKAGSNVSCRFVAMITYNNYDQKIVK